MTPDEIEAAKKELRDHWHSFADADPIPDGFIERMEAAGLVHMRPVVDSDLEEAFADERGIEPGGMLWELTPAGYQAWGGGSAV